MVQQYADTLGDSSNRNPPASSSAEELQDQIKAKAGEVAQQASETTSKAVEKVSAEASKLAEQTKEATSKAVDSATKSVNELLPKK